MPLTPSRLAFAAALGAAVFLVTWAYFDLAEGGPIIGALLAASLASAAILFEPILSRWRRGSLRSGTEQPGMPTIGDLEEFLPGSTAGEIHLAPTGYAFGDTTVQDIVLLTLAAKAIGAKRVFEIGSFRGRTSLNLARNLDPDARIFALDLDEREAAEMGLRNRLLAGSGIEVELPAEDPTGECIESGAVEEELRRKVTQLRGNSLRFDFSPYRGNVDFVFVDGGHTYEVVASDTANALEMVRPGGVVAWHDCDHNWPGVIRYLNELSKTRRLYRYGDTSLVFYQRQDVLLVSRSC